MRFTPLRFEELSARLNPTVTSIVNPSGFMLTFESGEIYQVNNGLISYSSTSPSAPSPINPNTIAQIINLTPAQINSLLTRMQDIKDRMVELNERKTEIEDELNSVYDSLDTVNSQLLADPNNQDLKDRRDLLQQKRDALLLEYVGIVHELQTLVTEYNNIVDLLNWSGDHGVPMTHLPAPIFDSYFYNQGYGLFYASAL